MGMGPRKLAVEFAATSPGAKAFAERVYALAEETLDDDDWYITVNFRPPKGERWDHFKSAPTIDVQRP